MNGKLTAHAIFRVLNARAQRFAEMPPGLTYTLNEITDLTASLEDDLVRMATGCGLREVVMAEQEVRDAWERANEALTKLEQANRHVSYGKRAVVDGSRFRNAVRVTEINDEPPF